MYPSSQWKGEEKIYILLHGGRSSKGRHIGEDNRAAYRTFRERVRVRSGQWRDKERISMLLHGEIHRKKALCGSAVG